MGLSQEVAMTEFDKGQKTKSRPKKYLWFGYGNYGSQPNLQIPAGNVRDPDLLQEFSSEKETRRSALRLFACAATAVIGLMLFVMMLAWVFTLVVR